MDINQANLDLIFRAAANTFQATLLKTPSISQEIATRIPMSTRQLTQGWLDRIPMMRRWKGNRVINNAVAHSRPIIAEPFEDTVALSKWDVKDDQLGIFSYAVAMLAEAVAKNPDALNTEFIKAAATLLGYDGVPVYSEDHPLLGGDVTGPLPVGAPATQSNLYVDTPLTFDNYVSVRANMRSLKGADGAPMMVTPNILMVPPALEGTGKMILEADFLSNLNGSVTPSGGAPQTNTFKNSAKLLVNPWLAGWDTNWWLLDTTSVVKPFADYELTAPLFTYLVDPQNPNVFMAAQFLYGAEERRAASETVWWLSAAATAESTYDPG